MTEAFATIKKLKRNNNERQNKKWNQVTTLFICICSAILFLLFIFRLVQFLYIQFYLLYLKSNLI